MAEDEGVAGEMPQPMDVKFLGVVREYNEQKNFGMIACEEAQAMWGQEIYVYKNVLVSANASVGDTVRFGIHVNPRGQPQASLPFFKVDEDGTVINLPKDADFILAEEAAANDPTFLETLKAALAEASSQQNGRRKQMEKGGKGGGKDWGKGGKEQAKGGKGGKDWGKAGPHGPEPWGKGHGGGGGGGSFGGQWREDPWAKGGAYDDPWAQGTGQPQNWGKGKGGRPMEVWAEDVTLFISGVPLGATRRELLHIFRQYAGFSSLNVAERPDHLLVFAHFATQPQAQFVLEALDGYVFDEEAPPHEQTMLALSFYKGKRQRTGK